MTTLYNCHTDGDQYRITKFDSLGNVESSYLCTVDECECPAGFRPSCRHRHMLPRFIAKRAVNSFYFYDYDRQGWVTNEPASSNSFNKEMQAALEADGEKLEALTGEDHGPEFLSEPAPSQQETSTFLYTTDEPPTPITHMDLFVEAESAPDPTKLRRRI